jgi:chromate transporter
MRVDAEKASLGELARVFLTLGTVAFGGPAAHIAMMEEEIVRRRGWVTHAEFLDMMGATQLIPGPNSTELAIHIGYARAGWPGLLVAGACFILPATAIVMVCAWAYVAFGSLPQAAGLLMGVKPVIIAVMAQAIWALGKSALKTPVLGGLAGVALALGLGGAGELAIVFGMGLGLALGTWVREGGDARGAIGLAPAALAPAAAAQAATAFGLWPLFTVFLKIGSVLFGSGYVLVAFLRGDLVTRLGWLTEAQLIDAVAVGQLTPGPVFTTATFIGYVLGGVPGALVATVGIFLPAFVFVAVSGPLIPRLRRSAVAGTFLDGVNAASLAVMAAVTVQLGRAALVDGLTLGLALVSAVLLLRFRVNSAWLVLGGALVGLLATSLR